MPYSRRAVLSLLINIRQRMFGFSVTWIKRLWGKLLKWELTSNTRSVYLSDHAGIFGMTLISRSQIWKTNILHNNWRWTKEITYYQISRLNVVTFFVQMQHPLRSYTHTQKAAWTVQYTLTQYHAERYNALRAPKCLKVGRYVLWVC